MREINNTFFSFLRLNGKVAFVTLLDIIVKESFTSARMFADVSKVKIIHARMALGLLW